MSVRLSETNHTWDPKSYAENSSVQQEAALQLLSLIKWPEYGSILDVGCGDGKITAAIARRVKGSVLGTDISQEMIRFANDKFTEIQNLEFIVRDAADLGFTNQFDCIFSSFALQWVKNIDAFFAGANKSLKNRGVLAATIALGFSDALRQSLVKLILDPRWSPYFTTFSHGGNFQTSEGYESLLKVHGFDVEYFALINQKSKFPSKDSLRNYLKQWLTYLNAVPDDLKSHFSDELMVEYFKREPVDSNGCAFFSFYRVDFIAKKNQT